MQMIFHDYFSLGKSSFSTRHRYRVYSFRRVYIRKLYRITYSITMDCTFESNSYLSPMPWYTQIKKRKLIFQFKFAFVEVKTIIILCRFGFISYTLWFLTTTLSELSKEWIRFGFFFFKWIELTDKPISKRNRNLLHVFSYTTWIFNKIVGDVVRLHTI